MKLQPNFSWQKYQGEPEDQQQQFQFQLQQQHIQVANTVNSTIDDFSYWTRERMTSETWIDGKAIWSKTLTGTIAGPAVQTFPLGATIRTLVSLQGTAQNAAVMSTFGLTLPYINTTGDDIGLFVDPNNLNVNVFTNTWNGYVFYVTIKYTKA